MRFFIVIISIALLVSVSTGCNKNLFSDGETMNSTSEIQYINELFGIDLSADCYVQDKTVKYHDDHDGAFWAKVVVTKDVFEEFSPADYMDVDDYTLDDAWYVLSEFETDEDIENLKIHKFYLRWSLETVEDINYQTTREIILTNNDGNYCIYFFSTLCK